MSTAGVNGFKKMNLKSKTTNENCKTECLTVIGLGYIGLPTAIIFAKNGWKVTGVDTNNEVVDKVNSGQLPFVEAGLEKELKQVVNSGALKATKDVPQSDVYIVSVPTPFKAGHQADLQYIDAATDSIIPLLSGDELIVLESTSPPGTTERMAQRVLSARPDLSILGEGGKPVVHFAHAPERVLPGNIMVEMTDNDRVIGALTMEAAEKAKQVYASFCEGELSVTDARTAEMVKLTENAFRDVNIAFANELSLISEKLDIDVWELIELANRHPRVNILAPGPGVGGHCIAVDPWFIAEAAPEESVLIQTARKVNDAKPQWVIDQVELALHQTTEEPQTVAILGLTFKPNIDDLRGSPALHIAETLIKNNKETQFMIAEPNISSLPEPLRSFDNAKIVDAETAVQYASVVALLVDHKEFMQIKNPRNEGKQLLTQEAPGSNKCREIFACLIFSTEKIRWTQKLLHQMERVWLSGWLKQ